jgi:hypothetical protein
MAESPYRQLQRRAKAAGLPANRSAKELEFMLAEGGGSNGRSAQPAASTSSEQNTRKAEPKLGKGTAGGEGHPSWAMLSLRSAVWVVAAAAVAAAVSGRLDPWLSPQDPDKIAAMPSHLRPHRPPAIRAINAVGDLLGAKWLVSLAPEDVVAEACSEAASAGLVDKATVC